MSDQWPTIAVLGAGRMGIGIAHVFAYAGFQVHLLDAKDRSDEDSTKTLAAAQEQIASNLQFLASINVFSPALKEEILNRIKYFKLSQLAESLEDVDIIFEGVPEVLEVKEQILRQASALVGSHVLIASTTSTFMVDTLAQFVHEPQRFMNTHWLNPAYLIPLVEVSPGKHTDEQALQEMLAVLEKAGKVPVTCAASPGFIVPRIQALAMNEAARIIEEGVASVEDVDKASRVGFGLRFAILGLLEFIDWGGGDILYYASNYLTESLQHSRYAPPEIIVKHMESGKIGMKSGAGFYNFESMELSAYQQETIKKFVDLLQHLGLLAPAYDPSLKA